MERKVQTFECGEGKLKEEGRPPFSLAARTRARRNRGAQKEGRTVRTGRGGLEGGEEEINCRGDKCHRDRPLIYYGDWN